MNKMKAAQISKPGGNWELVERDIRQPGAGQVRVKVEACGICHSDAPFGGAEWRCRGRARHWGTGTSRRSVCTADGVRDGRSWPREGQGSLGEEAGCAPLHRFGR